jgi:hypothetical protein
MMVNLGSREAAVARSKPSRRFSVAQNKIVSGADRIFGSLDQQERECATWFAARRGRRCQTRGDHGNARQVHTA